MSTGNFENWAGTIADIGPIYPFVGSEGFLAIAGLVFWVWWHIKQTKIENQIHEDELKRYGDKESLTKIVGRESPEDP